jgi:hypothetical protein
MNNKSDETKFQIMQTVAERLEQPEHNEITTAVFAARPSRKTGAFALIDGTLGSHESGKSVFTRDSVAQWSQQWAIHSRK